MMNFIFKNKKLKIKTDCIKFFNLLNSIFKYYKIILKKLLIKQYNFKILIID